METALFELARTDHRYAVEAYEFVCDAVTFTQELLGRHPDHRDESLRHVSGDELLRGACDLAIREYGFMAPIVFRRWGILTTDDFGELVFRLINNGRLSQSDDDDPSDFHDIFDLQQMLREGFALDASAYVADRVDR